MIFSWSDRKVKESIRSCLDHDHKDCLPDQSLFVPGSSFSKSRQMQLVDCNDTED